MQIFLCNFFAYYIFCTCDLLKYIENQDKISETWLLADDIHIFVGGITMHKDLIEKEALKFSIEHEIQQGRSPHIATNEGFDIISGDRQIEVRAKRNDGMPIILTCQNIEAVYKQPNFWLYVVYIDTSNKPGFLVKMNGEEVKRRKSELVHWKLHDNYIDSAQF